jgi:hypothetical protein
MDLYNRAFDWEPPNALSTPALSSTTIRQRIKAALTAWDLARVAPDLEREIEVTEVTTNYDFDKSLETLEGAHEDNLIDEILRDLG